jgi:zinc and cadmium transporter
MTASPALLLLVYCLAIALFSLVGGLLPGWVNMTHTRTQTVMSFVAGLMLGVAFYHLLPHSIASLGGPDAVDAVDVSVWWMMVGLIVMLLLLRMFHFHQHEIVVTDSDHHGHDHGREVPVQSLGWVGIALGLGLHTLIDGVALGAVMQGELAAGDTVGLLGIGVFLAILLHKPLDAMSITTIMRAGGWSERWRLGANLVFALMCPLGALLFFFGIDLVSGAGEYVVGIALAFSAGAFVCIALSDLLPEVHFHTHDRTRLTLAFIAGIALAYGLGHLEPGSLHTVAFSVAGVR